MIALWGIIAGIVLGYLRRGRLKHVAFFQPKHIWLIFLALAVQLLIFPTLAWPDPPIGWGTDIFHLGSYLLILVFLLLNRRVKPFWGIALGMGLNLLVIAANGGYMPADLMALRRAGQPEIAERLLASPDSTYGNVVVMSEETRLNLLGDRLFVPPWVPLASSLSLGDLLLMVSMTWLIQALMRRAPGAAAHRPGSSPMRERVSPPE